MRIPGKCAHLRVCWRQEEGHRNDRSSCQDIRCHSPDEVLHELHLAAMVNALHNCLHSMHQQRDDQCIISADWAALECEDTCVWVIIMFMPSCFISSLQEQYAASFPLASRGWCDNDTGRIYFIDQQHMKKARYQCTLRNGHSY